MLLASIRRQSSSASEWKWALAKINDVSSNFARITVLNAET